MVRLFPKLKLSGVNYFLLRYIYFVCIQYALVEIGNGYIAFGHSHVLEIEARESKEQNYGTFRAE
jgi:hypothetical protein